MSETDSATDPVTLLTEDDVAAILDVRAAYGCAEEAFRLLGDRQATNGVRTRTSDDHATVNTMTAIAPSRGFLGVKTYPVIRSDVTKGADFTLQLFDVATGRLRALIRADTLGQRRTGAASAVAAAHCARPGSDILGVIGTGWQAHGQVAAISAALPSVDTVLVASRDAEHAAAFRAEVEQVTGLAVRVASVRETAEAADVVVTATSSHTPVLDGRWLRPGALVCAVGSNYATKAEIDVHTVRRAGRIVVDAADVARTECGDLLAYWGRQDSGWERVTELGDVVAGRVTGRGDRDEIVLFESHGLALLDLIAGIHVTEEALRLGRGRRVSW